MTVLEMENIQNLPVERRILLAEDLWDSIRPQAEHPFGAGNFPVALKF